MCLNAYFLYCFIWIPREITFHPTFSVYLLDSFHVCLNISLYIKYGQVPAFLQASVCASLFLVGTHTCFVCTEVCLAVQVVCLQPREVTFAISHAQPFCPRPLPSRTQPVGASARTASPLLQAPPPGSRSFHRPLAPPSLDIKRLTLAFKQGQAKSSCQSHKLNTEVGGFGVVLETGGGVKRTGFKE